METLKDWMETIDDINNHRKDNGEETGIAYLSQHTRHSLPYK
jgi:hypothetical protein